MVNFLYKTFAGRFLLKIFTRPTLSRVTGCFMDSCFSRFFIKYFTEKHKINTDEFEKKHWNSFNDFFTRKLADGARPFSKTPNTLISPCDGFLSVFEISDALFFSVKNSAYNIESLLEDKELAKKFENGKCLVFRLTPAHYHRFHFFDNGYVKLRKHIPGILHTVRPIAVGNLPVYTQNTREYTLLETENFGQCVYMEVGAMLVGRIVNDFSIKGFKRGEEKGKFKFGGSTVILLFRENSIIIDKQITSALECQDEVSVKFGETIGKAF